MRQALSLRRFLLAGILLPVLAIIAVNSVMLYRQALGAVNTAYDRTLLASAKVIGEELDVQGYEEQARLRATVPYSALEAFEADNHSRLLYRVSSQSGEMVSGFAQLPFWHGTLPERPPYAALVDFYDDHVDGDDVRVAVLLQPVVSASGRAMAVVQVAETLELRRALARQILIDTIWRQAVLVAVIALVVIAVVQRGMRPVRRKRPYADHGARRPARIAAARRRHQPRDGAADAGVAQPEAVRARHGAPAAHAAGRAEDAGAIGAAWRPRGAAGAAGNQRHRRPGDGLGQPDAGARQGGAAAAAARSAGA
jgi:hypothetical protein